MRHDKAHSNRPAVFFLSLTLLTLTHRFAVSAEYNETFDVSPREPARIETSGWHLVTGTRNPTRVSADFSVNDNANIAKITTTNDSGSTFSSGHVFIENDTLPDEPCAFGCGDALLYTTEPLTETGANTLNLIGARLFVDYADGDALNSGPSIAFAVRVLNQWWIYESIGLGRTTATITHFSSGDDPLDTTFTFVPLQFHPNESYNADVRLIPDDPFARELTETELASITAVGIYIFPGSNLPARLDNFRLVGFSPIGTGNHAPILTDLSLTTSRDAVLLSPESWISLHFSDPDPGQSYIFYSADTDSVNGAPVSFNTNGDFTYDPRGVPAFAALGPEDSVTDSFTVTVADTEQALATATVIITVTGTASEGTPEGLTEGTPEGVVEGSAEGVAEGTAEGVTEGQVGGVHNADQNGDHRIDLSELLRVIQLYNSDGYHCDSNSEDGYAPGPGDTGACPPHAGDYHPQDWRISLSELLRLIQIYNSSGYTPCAEGEDGFCVIP
jgi:VCBS repeat-containing protein